jgi:peptide chain release factor subunit 1
MIKYEQLKQLEQIRGEEGIVSLYLKVEPRLMFEEAQPLIKFKEACKHFISPGQDPGKLKALEREKHRILDYLQSWIVRGRGLVIFACQPIGLFEIIHLDVPIPTCLEVDPTPKISILFQVLAEYPPFVVALVQKDRASIYVAEQRHCDKKTEIESEVHGWHSQGGWSQSRFQRHIDSQVNAHLRKVVDDLERMYYATFSFGALAIGGTDETTKELIKLLPDPLVRRVIGVFAIDSKHETEEEMLNKAQGLFEEHERQCEKELVDRIVNESRSGGHGVLGIDATIPTLLQGRVQKLVIADGTTQEGSVCQKCDYLSICTFDRCPKCGGALDQTADIVDHAVERAYLSGAHVETVFGDAGRSLLAEGGIGALLRY